MQKGYLQSYFVLVWRLFRVFQTPKTHHGQDIVTLVIYTSSTEVARFKSPLTIWFCSSQLTSENQYFTPPPIIECRRRQP